MITAWYRKRQEVIPAFVFLACCEMIWLLLGLFLQQFKIGDTELIALYLALHFRFADGIAKTFLVMRIAMVIDSGAVHKIIFAFKPNCQLASVPFHLEHAGATAGLQCKAKVWNCPAPVFAFLFPVKKHQH